MPEDLSGQPVRTGDFPCSGTLAGHGRGLVHGARPVASDARWHRVKELLHESVQLAPAQRAAFLDEECGADADLRSELDSLIDENARMPSGFLESPLPTIPPDEY